MAYTTTDLANLDQAIASSELEVEVNGRKTRFDNFAGLKARRDYVAQQIADEQRRTGSFRFRFATSRGE